MAGIVEGQHFERRAVAPAQVADRAVAQPQGEAVAAAPATSQPKAAPAKTETATPPPAARRRMSYKEQKELEMLPARIEQLESDVATLTDAMHDPAFYQRDSATIVAHNTKLAEAQAALDVAYARWMELDAG